MTDAASEAWRDLDWFALDDQGMVGHFASGGCGALPDSVVASPSDRRRLEDYFYGLPKISRAIIPPDVAADNQPRTPLYSTPEEVLEAWVDLAARGLYSYDYVAMEGRKDRPYCLMARPERPIHVNELAGEFGRLLRRTVLTGIEFARDAFIPVESIRPNTSSGRLTRDVDRGKDH